MLHEVAWDFIELLMLVLKVAMRRVQIFLSWQLSECLSWYGYDNVGTVCLVLVE